MIISLKGKYQKTVNNELLHTKPTKYTCRHDTTTGMGALLVITRGQATPLSNILFIMGYNVYALSMESHLGVVIHFRECFNIALANSPTLLRIYIY